MSETLMVPEQETAGFTQSDSDRERNKKIEQGKKDVFVFNDSFSYRTWQGLQKDIKQIQKNPDLEEQTKEFCNLIEDVYTGNSEYTSTDADNEKRLPALALVDLFERSFSYFKHPIPQEQKNQLIELQLAFLSDPEIPTEAKNVLKGVWGYYADPERRAAFEDPETEDHAIRQGYFEAVESYREKFDQKNQENNPGALVPLQSYLYLPSEKSWKNFDPDAPAKEISYFASLYESDHQALEPELSGVLVHTLELNQNIPREYEPTGVKMPAHDRVFVFERDRVPRQAKIESGRVQFFITSDNAVLGEQEERQQEIIGDSLPLELLAFFKNRAASLRYSEAYRKADLPERAGMRREVVKDFIADLMEEQSELWISFSKTSGLSEHELLGLKSLLKKYNKFPELFLVSRIAINRDSN